MQHRIARLGLLSLLFALTPLLSPEAQAAIPSSQRDALLALYNATGGPQWINHSGWSGAAGTECSWQGVDCAQDTVASISLSENNLVGELPSSTFTALPDLEYLALNGNSLTGVIPPAVGTLSKLKYLYLETNELSGAIPPELGSLPQLIDLDLSENLLTGRIPTQLGQLSQLETLILASNELTETIPAELGNLRSLRYLGLADNRLVGPIPDFLMRLPALEALDLSDNSFSGPIPAGLTSLTALQELVLSYNSFSGPIPPQLGTMTTLQRLDLSGNGLSGSIPPELGNLRNLAELSLSYNALTGGLPRELGQLSNLIYFDVDSNSISGALPAELSNAQSLVGFSAYDNLITGTVPASLARLTNLQFLDLSANELSGSIPVELMQLTNLRLLGLGNHLTGTIPPQIGNLVNLGVLDLGINELEGTIPPEIGALSALTDLWLHSNRLSGEIPPSITSLSNLEYLALGDNELTGPIPASIGNLHKLDFLYLSYNLLTGAIPSSIGNLTAIEYLYLDDNMLTGPVPPELGRLTKLSELAMENNQLTGTIPAALGDLASLTFLALSWNELSGNLPSEIFRLTNLENLLLGGNSLSGPIPAEVASLRNLTLLGLDMNRFSGTIPPSIGQLTKLDMLLLGNNQLSGEIPATITNLTSLQNAGGLEMTYDSLYTTDNSVRAFVNSRVNDGDFEATQNRTPTGFSATPAGTSIVLSWNRVRYYWHDGGYEIEVSRTNGGPPEETILTPSKELTSTIVPGLAPSTTYYFRIRTVTFPHDDQQSELVSEWSPVIQAQTDVVVFVSRPKVVVTTLPYGMVQETGRAQAEDFFVITNVGDKDTTVTAETTSDFFILERTIGTVAAHDSEYFGVAAIAKPTGAYRGVVALSGDGVKTGTTVTIDLLSTPPAAGEVIAEATVGRVDVSAPAGVNPTGTVSFTNTGTATLNGIAVADVPWLIPATGVVTIAPAETKTVAFSVDRSLRPDAADPQGAVSGNFSLVYAGFVGLAKENLDAMSPSASSSSVTIVDNVLAAVVPSTLPPLSAGEIALVIPGVRQSTTSGKTVVADISLTNAFGTAFVQDLKMFYGKEGSGAPASVSNVAGIAVGQSLKLADVVKSVYSQQSQTGAVHLRSAETSRLAIFARLVEATSHGTTGTVLPLFRSDRASVSGQTIILTGIAAGTSYSTDFYLQEMGGTAASVSIAFLGANGATLLSRPADALSAFSLRQLPDVAPPGAVTARILIGSGSVSAFAVVTDKTSGDQWTVNDGASYYSYKSTESLLLPVGALGGREERRRPIRRGGVTGAPTAPLLLTELTLHNRERSTASIALHFRDGGSTSDKSVTLEPGATLTIPDLLAFFNRSSQSQGYVVIDPMNHPIAASARLYVQGPHGACSTAIPLLSAKSGLRVGQSKIFSAIDDSTVASGRAGRGATFSTSLILIESTGHSAKVRASLAYADGNSLAGLAGEKAKEFTLPAGGILVVPNLAASIFGEARETSLGDLLNIALHLQVIEGEGGVIALTHSIDNGTKDPLLRSD